MKHFLLLVLVVAHSISYGQKSFSWTQVADYPYDAWGMSSCNYNDTLYTFSNCGSSNNTLYKYTNTTDKWDTLAKLTGTGICNITMAAVAGKIYLIGNGQLHIYDITTNLWNANAMALPATLKKDGASTVVLNNDIYIAGGGSSTTANFFKFNTTTQTFSQMAAMSTPRENAQMALLKNKIYIVGGRNANKALNTGEVYDIASDSWSNITPLFADRYFGFAVADTGYVYIMGGETGTNSYKYKSIEVFDPVNNTVTILDTTINDMNVQHTAYALGIAGTKLVAAAGFTNTPTNDITNYCESTDFVTAVNIMKLNKQKVDFTMYPNPATDIINIAVSSNSNIIGLNVYNSTGRLVIKQSVAAGSKSITIATTTLPAGNYIVTAYSNTGAAQSQTITLSK